MSRWKTYSIISGLFGLGLLQETFRILTEEAPSRKDLLYIPAVIGVLALGLIYLAIRFWRKALRNEP